jgi:hypothetical protein
MLRAALSYALMLTVALALLLSSGETSRVWAQTGPIEVGGDNRRAVDIRVRHDGSVRSRGAVPKRPMASDAPQEFDVPCVVPDGAPERFAPSCLAGSGGVPEPGPGTTVVDAALEARGRLILPVPAPSLRPLLRFGGRNGGVTGAPIWLWTNASHWSPGGTPLTRRVQAGPVWATVSAAAVRMVWLPGDGSVVTCLTPGTPLTDPSRGMSGSPDCGYTYRRTSANQSGGRYQVTISVTWAVTWVGSDGRSGALAPLTVATTFPYTVRQARAQLISPS